MIKFKDYNDTYDSLAEGTLTTDAFEELSLAGRRALARSAKKNRMKLARGRKIWKKRKAGTSRINRRASRQARSDLKKKFSGGRKVTSVAAKKNLERRASKMGNRLKQLSRMQRAPKRRADRR
ncbi:MAG: hypothetical protein CBB96_05240 [Gammaproteobacteria bacterium TMED36]|nr:MAG: hypothetical protein CBB96_05240 [Gammaproteobacteria bacterium TMED36]|tara:strand:- start:2403 stop:2771 length:369 start_codon:yes stop_codon:yes gene_type:complete